MTHIDYDPYREDGPMGFPKHVPPMNNIDLEIVAGIFGNLCSHSDYCVRAEYERGIGTVYDLLRWGLGLKTKIQHCPHDDLYEKDMTLCIAGCTKEAWHSCLTLDDFSERWRKERVERRGPHD